MTLDPAVGAARDLLHRARRILVLTGAGISAECGVPTFRGADGLWKRHRPEELATPEAFRRDPRLVWEWYAWRRELLAACEPGVGHRALARWLAVHSGSARLATQNVDGLHVRAGRECAAGGSPGGRESQTPPPPLELHGSLFRVRCTGCGREEEHAAPVDATSAAALPRCATCGALLRPAVVWFGEVLPAAVLEDAVAWARGADLALVVGTSALVHPAASLPLLVLARGGTLVEVNPEPSALTSRASVTIRRTAGEALPLLLGTGELPGVRSG